MDQENTGLLLEDKDKEPTIEDINAAASMDDPPNQDNNLFENQEPEEPLPENVDERKQFILRKIDEEFAKKYDNKTLFLTLSIVSFCMILVNIDHGSLPGCIEAIEKKLAIQNFGYGILGTLVYTGFMIGSLFGTWIFANSQYNRQILSVSLLICTICLIFFALTNTYWVALIWRFFAGFGQVAITIFSPWWADTYGSQQVKSLSITLFQLCTPLGLFFGYGMTAFMTLYYEWEYSFYIQAGLLVPGIIGILMTPKKFLDIDQAIIHRSKITQRVYERYGLNESNVLDISEKVILSARQPKLHFSRAAPDSLGNDEDLEDEINEDEPSQIRQNMNTSQNLNSSQKFGRQNSMNQSEIYQPAPAEPYWNVIKIVLTNKTFVFLLLTITGIFYIVAGIQNWLPYYVKNVLLIDKQTADEFFLFLTLTAPISGVAAGGSITTFMLGGYNSRNTLVLVQYATFITALVILPIPLTANFQIFGILMWLALFFGGFALPAMTGILLNSVDEQHRGVAQSIAMFSYNALGYMPAPMVYGFVSSFVDDVDINDEDASDAMLQVTAKSRIPMASILYSVFLTVLFMHLGLKEKFAEYEEFTFMQSSPQSQEQTTMDFSDEQGTLMDEDQQDKQSLLKKSKSKK